jgi:hypothetical protein
VVGEVDTPALLDEAPLDDAYTCPADPAGRRFGTSVGVCCLPVRTGTMEF